MYRIQKLCKGRIIISLMVVLAAIGCGVTAMAQEFGLSYDTELHSRFRDEANWVNLLKLDASLNVNNFMSVRVGTISTCSTNDGSILSNILTYSNIEEENIPFALSRLGFNYQRNHWKVFAGVCNVNDAFFITPVTSIFTNSSCGIFPTISYNFDIANFPNASIGVEVEYINGDIIVNSALYNGKGYHGFKGDNCVFRISPCSDGVFNINSVNYKWHDSNYNMGVGIHSRSNFGYEVGNPESFKTQESREKEKAEVFYWIYIEQQLTKNISLIAQYSQCSTSKKGCRNFYGIGFSFGAALYDIGVYSCYADFSDKYECASELTFKYQISPQIYLQPALHYINGSLGKGIVGLFRLNLNF